MKIKFILLAICLLASSLTFAGENKRMALFDFEGVSGGLCKDGEAFSSLLFAALAKDDSLEMVERKRIAEIMKERKLKRSGMVNSNYLQLASIVNADYIVTGRIYIDYDEDHLLVNLRLTRCYDGKIFGKCFIQKAVKGNNYIEATARKAAAFISGKFSEKQK